MHTHSHTLTCTHMSMRVHTHIYVLMLPHVHAHTQIYSGLAIIARLYKFYVTPKNLASAILNTQLGKCTLSMIREGEKGLTKWERTVTHCSLRTSQDRLPSLLMTSTHTEKAAEQFGIFRAEITQGWRLACSRSQTTGKEDL